MKLGQIFKRNDGVEFIVREKDGKFFLEERPKKKPRELKIGDFVEWCTNDFWKYWHGGTVVKETKSTVIIRPTNDSIFKEWGLVRRKKDSLVIPL